MKDYKPLVSCAPAHSILNASFHYTNSVSTDIGKTFNRVRREQAKAAILAALTNNVLALPKKTAEISRSAARLQPAIVD
ncbi:MAG TPA: hypothetical protein VMV45_11335 [Casimicrobiaceae bacterium]|nr:hypothetical protein [Casimicrobiaceae bacterium]